jgi:glycosyltransferase involved in cell wall biosynthesis
MRNGADTLAETLESLLKQTLSEIAVVLVDDASTDDTPRIAQHYAALDSRVTYMRLEDRAGMVGAWRRARVEATQRYPRAPYFAWASDHDIWHPSWATELADALDANPDAVLAYPFGVGIDDEWTVIRKTWRFQTLDRPELHDRLHATIRGMSAGNMVYGLARTVALPDFRYVLLPDKLYLYELAAQGTFVQVPRTLWYRRYRVGVVPSLTRQRQTLFRGNAPRHTYLSWWVVHAGILFRDWVLGTRRPHGLTRLDGLRAASGYYMLNEAIERKKQARRVSKRLRRHRVRAAAVKRIRNLTRSRDVSWLPGPARAVVRAVVPASVRRAKDR